MRWGKIGARRMMWSDNDLLPPGARWVEYLESTGTQWIDTGIVPDNNTIVEYDFAPTSITAGKFFCGCWGNISTRGRMYLYVSGDGKAQYGFGLGQSAIGVNFANWTNNFPLSVHKYRMERTKLLIDGVSAIYGLSGDMTGNTLSFYLFKCNDINNRESNGSKVHGCRMYNTNILVRDLRPIAIGNTGYMLDLVSGEYLPYGNQGTGDFVIGPDTNAPAI